MSNDFGVIILAGGNSSRMGLNKSFLKIGNESLIERVVESASKVSNNIVITIGKNDKTSDYSSILPRWVRVEKDSNENKAAIYGVLTGLEVIKAKYVAVLAVDLPFANAKVIEILKKSALEYDLAIPCWPNGNIEPLFAVYHVPSALKAFRGAVNDNKIKLKDAIERLEKVSYVNVEKFREVDPNLCCFININTPNDISSIKEIFNSVESSKLTN